MKKLILFCLITTLTFFVTSAQEVNEPTSREKNSVYNKEKHITKKMQPYTELREADIMWSRKIWREIDLRQKINHPFYYPENDGVGHTINDRKSLIDVIYSAIQEGAITAYGNATMDDEFRSPMTTEEIKSIGGAKVTIDEAVNWDKVAQGMSEEEAMEKKVTETPFNRNTVKKWRVKEEWFFDKQRSVMDVRIIGLAPLQEDKDEVTGQLTGTFSPLFWVWFEEAREVLINAPAFNLVKNDAERRTYDDIFWKRMFGSTIVKEANVMDRKVNEYMIGLDALLEADRIKAEIFNLEHDLWEY